MKRNERVKTIDVCPFIFRIYVDRQTVEFDTYKEVANLPDHVKLDIGFNMKIVSSVFQA
ncbi:hypothetical protein Acj9p100 [Acinetobacter phage Acj9]|uniref:Uncharacterized protein n=1 Tax=Acinetobacter phage Acj9 TaxID=760939 RepID=E5EPN4_9CAUD|nr:hypothetical protein Acj9p100 [Acinetobacter phage Acj9]ADG60000.1 hypothetical protein Acj9p100 [Acinetobacter phage Acj9]